MSGCGCDAAANGYGNKFKDWCPAIALTGGGSGSCRALPSGGKSVAHDWFEGRKEQSETGFLCQQRSRARHGQAPRLVYSTPPVTLRAQITSNSMAIRTKSADHTNN